MTKLFPYSLLLILLLGHCRPLPEKTPLETAKVSFQQDVAVLQNLLKDQFLPLAEQTVSQDSLQKAFLTCRLTYKKIEHFTEYFFPTTARLINGPPLPEYELEENKSFEPGGFQMMEELLYPYDTTQREELIRETRKLSRELKRIEQLWEATELTDAHLFDAVRLQLFRLITLGISGFDTPLCQNTIPETAISLNALSEIVKSYQSKNATEGKALQLLFQQSSGYVRTQPDFNGFDRATFITDYLNPLSKKVLSFQKSIEIQPFTELRALRGDVATLFDKDAFNPDFYASNANDAGNETKTALGQKLFYTPLLSANGRRSCATCHQPDRAFTDGLPKSAAFSKGFIQRNAPTILYAALQKGLFYDQRSTTLESQTQDVIQNKDEMHGSLAESSQRLQKSTEWVALFKKAFPNLKRIEPYHIMNALASYERTLTPFQSRFDRYMRGEKTLLSAAELRGFNLFMGKAKCGICHFMPLFNGTVPPSFSKTESEVIGILENPDSKKIDPDPGKFVHYPTLPDLKYAFKTPTVRNVALTAPYMHNGAYQTLEEVVEFYNQGGATGLGIELPNQTLPFDRLNLSVQEKAEVVAFMKTLTDETPVNPKAHVFAQRN
jgi:cytochrome c peroxidase